MMGLHPAAWMLVHMTSETILHLAKMGNSVIVGRGANIVTRKLNHGLHVRLVGSLEKRIKHIQDYYKLAREQAEHFIKDEDRGRASYLNRHFGRDIDDPLNYSLVLNTDRVSYDEAAKLIGDQAIRQLA
jgi:cytidylate kinase